MRRAPVGLRTRIERLSERGLGWREYATQAAGALAASVGAESWCLATADPSTLLMTNVIVDGEQGVDPHFFRLEYGTPDYLMQTDLARGPARAGALSRATEGRLDRSTRWRELIEPGGFGDQLRAALVSRRGCWGFLAMVRDRNRAGFAYEDVRVVSKVAAAIADGLRLSVLIEETRTGTPEDPSLVVLDGRLSVVSTTPWASALLDADVEPGGRAPDAVLAVAARALEPGSLTPAFARVRVTGGWLSLSASQMRTEGEPVRIAVIVQRAAPAQIIDVLLGVSGMTRRQAEITRLVLAGRSTSEIACTLHISPLTVQQHLKSVFGKMGVRSRRELVGAIFDRNYLTRMLPPADEPPAPSVR